MLTAFGHPSASPHHSAFARSHAPPHRRKALVLAILATLCLFGLLFLASYRDRAAELPAGTIFTFTVGEADGASPDEPGAKAERPGGASATPSKPAPMPRIAPRLAAAETPVPVVPKAPLTLNFIEPPIRTESLTAPTDLTAPSAQVADDLGPSGAGGLAGDAGGGAGKGSGGGEGDGIGNGRGDGGGDGRKVRVLIASWAPTMDHSQNYRYYPAKAREAGIEGVAILKCLVLRRDRVRDCQLIDEAPRGHDFGKAALRAAPSMRIRVHDHTGKRVYNEWVAVRKNFITADLAAQPAASAAAAPREAPSP